MVETETPAAEPQSIDEQTQFGNTREFEPSDCIFVFKETLSDYEEPASDEEVSTFVCLFVFLSLFFIHFSFFVVKRFFRSIAAVNCRLGDIFQIINAIRVRNVNLQMKNYEYCW